MAPEDEDSSYRWLPPRNPPVEQPSPAPAPVAPWMQVPRKRANGHAVGISAMVGAVVWLAVDIFETQRGLGNAAFVAGRSLVPAVLAAGLVAIIARSSNKRWPLWRYPALIVSIALGVTLLRTLDDGSSTSSSTPERRTDADPTESVPDVRRTVEVPALVGPWARDDSAAAQARIQQAEEQVQGGLGAEGTTADIAFYGNDGQQAMLLVITGQQGSRFDEETSASPRQAVVDALAGAGVEQRSMVDPGPLGGALGCGPSTQRDQLFVCSWAELGMSGILSFVDGQLPADTAAETTRLFRSATEH